MEAVTLTALADDVFGDLLDPGNPAVADNTCPAQPAAIPVGGTFSCSFEAFVAGDAGDPDHLDTVTAAVVDDDGETGRRRRLGHGGLRRCAAGDQHAQDRLRSGRCRSRGAWWPSA